MGKIAIVGTSKLIEGYETKFTTSIVCNELFREPGISIITGDADGVDSIARHTKSPDSSLDVIMAPAKQWENKEGKVGYKIRNMKIAEKCDELICITTRTRREKCYHCNLDHERTGGCWTMGYAKSLDKPTRLYVI